MYAFHVTYQYCGTQKSVISLTPPLTQRDASQSGIFHYSTEGCRYIRKAQTERYSVEKMPRTSMGGRVILRRSLSRRSPRSGRQMAHLRRPRIDVQIGGPFTQQHAASDTLAPSREHKMKEEVGSTAFPHKEDCLLCHLLDKLWEAPRAGNFNIKECLLSVTFSVPKY